MKPDAPALLWDAREAARDIARFTLGKRFDDYVANDMLRSAVERQFMIVGEALSQLRKIDPDVAAQISDLRAAVGLRNVLVHGYATVEDARVWEVVEVGLAKLVVELDALLAGLE